MKRMFWALLPLALLASTAQGATEVVNPTGDEILVNRGNTYIDVDNLTKQSTTNTFASDIITGQTDADSGTAYGIEVIDGNWRGGVAGDCTLIVCASNTTNTGGCDYLCGGTADEVEINAAAATFTNGATAVNGGGKLCLSDGKFELDDTIVIQNRNVAIVGAGTGATILHRDTDYGDTIYFSPVDNVNDMIYHNTVSDLKFFHNTVPMTHGSHIHMESADRSWITNIETRGHFGGIHFEGSGRAFISNWLSNTGTLYTTEDTYHLKIGTGPNTANYVSYLVMVDGFNFTHETSDTYVEDAIEITNADTVYLLNGHINGVSESAIHLNKTTDPSLITVIADNVYFDGENDTGVPHVLIEGNNTVGNYADIKFRGCNFAGHDITDKGIHITSTSVRDVKISESEFNTYRQQGIDIDAGSSFLINDNQIEGNNTSDGGYNGIDIAASLNEMVVQDNIIGNTSVSFYGTHNIGLNVGASCTNGVFGPNIYGPGNTSDFVIASNYAGKIYAADLSATDSPGDNEVPTYDDSTGKVTWEALGSGYIDDSNDSVSPDNIMSTGKVDERCLTYEDTGDTFEWADCGGAAEDILFVDLPGNATGTDDTWAVDNSPIYVNGGTTGQYVWYPSLGNIGLERSNDGTSPAALALSSSHGSMSAKTVVADGDNISRIQSKGYSAEASNQLQAASIYVYIDGEPDTASDTSDMPGRLSLRTSPDGASVPVQRFNIRANGDKEFISEDGTTIDVVVDGTTGNATVNAIATIGVAASGSNNPQLIVRGGQYGSDIIRLDRTEGTTRSFGWSLAGDGLLFTDRTAGEQVAFLRYDTGASIARLTIPYDEGAGEGDPGVDGELRAGVASSGGTNLSGGSLSIAGGFGTGSGDPGEILFKIAARLSSGTTSQSVPTVGMFDTDGNFSAKAQTQETSTGTAYDILELSGAFLNNDNQSADKTDTLADIDSDPGVHFLFTIVEELATDVSLCLDAASDNKFELDGTVGTDGGCICILGTSSDEKGSKVGCAGQTSDGGVDWFCSSGSVGEWVIDDDGTCDGA